MSSGKRYVTVIAVILFLFSLTILALNIFDIPPDAGEEYELDKIYFYGLHIALWLSAPYLLSLIVKKILWKSEFKNAFSAKSIGLAEDTSIVLIYLVSLFILFSKLFRLSLSFDLVLLFVIIAAVTIYLRPKFLKLTKAGFITSARPFKTGDWITLRNKGGADVATGKIISFDPKSVRLKSESDTLLIVPNNILTEFIIENFHGIEREVKLNLTVKLNGGIEIERGKRILAAAARQALLSVSEPGSGHVEVLIENISETETVYNVKYTCIPWEEHTPQYLKDSILTTINHHLKIAGIRREEGKENNILAHAGLFDKLTPEELEYLLKSSVKNLFQGGDTIIRQGDSGSSMFVLAEGILKVTINAGDRETIKAANIFPGQFFGEMSLFTGEARSATVIAETDSVTIEITKDAVKNILKGKPELVNNFSEIIAERQGQNLKAMDDYLNRKDSFIQKFALKIKSFFEI